MIGILVGPPEFEMENWSEEQKEFIKEHSDVYLVNVWQAPNKLLYFLRNANNKSKAGKVQRRTVEPSSPGAQKKQHGKETTQRVSTIHVTDGSPGMENLPQAGLRVTPGAVRVTETRRDAHPGGESDKKENTSPAIKTNLV